MMNQLGVVKDQDWPLNDLAGPLVVNCLPLINSLVSSKFKTYPTFIANRLMSTYSVFFPTGF